MTSAWQGRLVQELRGLTAMQWALLEAADRVSLPGDGYRIKGPGQHRIARNLETRKLVRVAQAPGEKARVHVTKEGRIALRFKAGVTT